MQAFVQDVDSAETHDIVVAWLTGYSFVPTMNLTRSIHVGENMITMHPGEYLSLSYVEPYKISLAELAERLSLPSNIVRRLMAQELDLTAEMAVKLELAFDRSAESWLKMQSDYSLAQARKKVDPVTVRPFTFPPREDAA